MANNNNLIIAGIVALGVAVIAGLYWNNTTDNDADTLSNQETASPTATPVEDDNDDTANNPGLFGRLTENNNLSTVVTAIRASELTETLQGDDPYTIFAPTNEAFAALPEGTLDNLLNNRDQLTSILNYHIVMGEYDQFTDGQMLTTVQGQTLRVSERDGQWYVNDNIRVLDADVDTPDGAIYTIDGILMPQ